MHMNSIYIIEFISLKILLPIRGPRSRFEVAEAVAKAVCGRAAVDYESGLDLEIIARLTELLGNQDALENSLRKTTLLSSWFDLAERFYEKVSHY